jgi:hypothetical protein
MSIAESNDVLGIQWSVDQRIVEFLEKHKEWHYVYAIMKECDCTLAQCILALRRLERLGYVRHRADPKEPRDKLMRRLQYHINFPQPSLWSWFKNLFQKFEGS